MSTGPAWTCECWYPPSKWGHAPWCASSPLQSVGNQFYSDGNMLALEQHLESVKKDGIPPMPMEDEEAANAAGQTCMVARPPGEYAPLSAGGTFEYPETWQKFLEMHKTVKWDKHLKQTLHVYKCKACPFERASRYDPFDTDAVEDLGRAAWAVYQHIFDEFKKAGHPRTQVKGRLMYPECEEIYNIYFDQYRNQNQATR